MPSCSRPSRQGTSVGSPTGITAKARTATVMLISGARKKMPLSTARGMMFSLKKSFSPSAAGSSRPAGPALLGPSRTCMRAITLRSNQVL